MAQRHLCRERHLYRVCILLIGLTGFSPVSWAQKAPPKPNFVLAEIYGVYGMGNRTDRSRLIYLHQTEANRFLQIVVGHCEGNAVWRKLHQVDFPRPLTHDLFQNVLAATGTRILSVQIDQLRPLDDRETGSTYFAILTLEQADGTRLELDARPSDSLALSVRMGFPIYVARQILEENGLSADQVPEKPSMPPISQSPSQTKDFY